MFMNYFNADNQVDQTHRWHSSDSRFDFVRWWTNVFRIHMNNRSYAIFFTVDSDSGEEDTPVTIDSASDSPSK